MQQCPESPRYFSDSHSKTVALLQYNTKPPPLTELPTGARIRINRLEYIFFPLVKYAETAGFYQIPPLIYLTPLFIAQGGPGYHRPRQQKRSAADGRDRAQHAQAAER